MLGRGAGPTGKMAKQSAAELVVKPRWGLLRSNHKSVLMVGPELGHTCLLDMLVHCVLRTSYSCCLSAAMAARSAAVLFAGYSCKRNFQASLRRGGDKPVGGEWHRHLATAAQHPKPKSRTCPKLTTKMIRQTPGRRERAESPGFREPHAPGLTAVKDSFSEACVVLQTALRIQEGAPVVQAEGGRPDTLARRPCKVDVLVHQLKHSNARVCLLRTAVGRGGCATPGGVRGKGKEKTSVQRRGW